MKHGKTAVEQHGQKPPPGLVENTNSLDFNLSIPEGLYFDGKKCDTLVRETKVVNVQVKHLEKILLLFIIGQKGEAGSEQRLLH